MKKHLNYILLLLVFMVVSCAKRGAITGGLKDTLAPVLKTSLPKNFSTEFTGNTIKLTFDEYVKLKDVSKQLVISPPMKIQPVITPSNASKEFTIKIKDTLQPNTTYSFNFGQSVTDNNEGNVYPQFKYVFSTGSYIDSLSLGGSIKDAYSKKTDNFVSVMLYEVNDSFTDSIIYKEPPRYITNTLDTLTQWKLENLKEGKYLLIALKDNNNNKYDPKSDKIAFVKNVISIPSDSVYNLKIFKEEVSFRALKPSLDNGQKLIMGYEGTTENLKVTLKNGNETLKSVITQVPDKDSVNIWFRPLKADSLYVNASRNAYTKEYYTKIKSQKKDTLSFKPNVTSTLPLRSNFILESSIPLSRFDKTKMFVHNKDSVAVDFTTQYDSLYKKLEFDFPKEAQQKYTVRLMPGAITDFYDSVNDTLNYSLSTKNNSDYGNMRVTLENTRRFPVIVEFTDAKGVVKAQAYSEGETVIDFNSLEPAVYTLRLIYDDNKNRLWDSGNYLKKIQPEEVIYFPKDLEIRANWDYDQPFSLP